MRRYDAVVRPVLGSADPDWLALRRALWPHRDETFHRSEMAALAGAPTRHAQLLALPIQGTAGGTTGGTARETERGRAVGLIEVSVRSEYVNGAHHRPVAFLEGIYVSPPARRQGVGRRLFEAACGWARERGLVELAADTPRANAASRAFHLALGLTETETVVFFRKDLRA